MCPACLAAEQHPTRDEFAAGCIGCKARAMAVTRADLLEDYRGAVQRLFGDQAKQGHELVKQWLGRMRQARAAA